MKKIILILFLFLIFYTSYIIYNLTTKQESTYLLIGDSLSNNPYIKNINSSYINNNYRIIDILNILKYNEENNNISLHRLIKNSNIIIVSIGMNDIYNIGKDNLENIYTYININLNNYKEILNYINRYDKKEVYVLGYYNILDKYNDLFTYTNYKLSKICSKYHYKFIDLNKEITKEDLEKETNYYINNQGYYKISKIIVEKLKKT